VGGPVHQCVPPGEWDRLVGFDGLLAGWLGWGSGVERWIVFGGAASGRRLGQPWGLHPIPARQSATPATSSTQSHRHPPPTPPITNNQPSLLNITTGIIPRVDDSPPCIVPQIPVYHVAAEHLHLGPRGPVQKRPASGPWVGGGLEGAGGGAGGGPAAGAGAPVEVADLAIF